MAASHFNINQISWSHVSFRRLLVIQRPHLTQVNLFKVCSLQKPTTLQLFIKIIVRPNPCCEVFLNELLFPDRTLDALKSYTYKYTAKLLFHQSPTRHSEYSDLTVTMKPLLTTAGSMVTTQLINLLYSQPWCRQLTTVTTMSLSSHCAKYVTDGIGVLLCSADVRLHAALTESNMCGVMFGTVQVHSLHP